MWRCNLDLSQTIFNLVSGSLPSAVAIIRISGDDAYPLVRRLFSPLNGNDLPRERGMLLGILRDRSGQQIDRALALTFVAPHSFTGEDTVELQCHGSIAIWRQLQS